MNIDELKLEEQKIKDQTAEKKKKYYEILKKAEKNALSIFRKKYQKLIDENKKLKEELANIWIETSKTQEQKNYLLNQLEKSKNKDKLIKLVQEVWNKTTPPRP